MTSNDNCRWFSTALQKKISTLLLKYGKNNGIAVHIPKETVLNEMEAKTE
jgi:hypothetical protein